MKRSHLFRLSVLLFLPAVALMSGALAASGDDPPTGARYVGDEACFECHEESMQLSFDQIHARIESFEVKGMRTGCEGCHGPGSLHAESADAELIRAFGPGGQGDSACLECHQYKGLRSWHASTHNAVGVGCGDCHEVHGEFYLADEAGDQLLPGPSAAITDKRSPYYSCQTCHADTMAMLELPYRHPLREGKMNCGSCHDPHGAGEAMLNTPWRSVETCYTCHQNIEGPHVFEHPPVQEDCAICHNPHGSVAPAMLTVNQPTLCLQCHDYHFHAGYRASDDHEVDVGGTEFENPWGPTGFNRAFATNCTQCHSQVHGSDLPSQSLPGLSQGLTQ